MSHLDCINVKSRLAVIGNEHCISCGSIIPEGQQVCADCLSSAVPEESDKDQIILQLHRELSKAKADSEYVRQNYYSKDALLLVMAELKEYQELGTVEELAQALELVGGRCPN